MMFEVLKLLGVEVHYEEGIPKADPYSWSGLYPGPDGRNLDTSLILYECGL